MIPTKRSADKGQALVEFALILIVLLLFIFIIIEAGRAFQSWLTLQNAARSAGRYAITGQFETDCLFAFPACLDPRVQSIKDEGRRASSGLPIDDEADIGLPQSFVTEVWSVDEGGTWIPDFAGGSADPIRVRVTYYMPFVTPLFRPIAEMVRLRGQVVVVAEDYDQLGTSQVQSSAPPIGNAGDPGIPGPTGGNPDLDLELDKSASALNVQADSPLDYTLDVINHGPFDAENVTIVDTLPAGTTFLAWAVTGAGTTGGEYCEEVSLEVTCYLPNLAGNGSILNSASVTLETRSPDAQGTTITNTATVFNGTTALDTDNLNNTDSVTVTIGAPSADLAVTIVDSPPVFVSAPLTYTITAYNNGPDDATGVAVTVNLSDDLGPPVIPNGVPCSIISNVMISCVPDSLLSPGDLPNGASQVFEFAVTAPDSSDTITAIANIAGNESDPDTDNNSASVVTTISDTLADAYVQKSAPPGPLPVDVAFTYTIVAGNNGPDEIDSLIVTDILPDSVSLGIPLDDGCIEGGGGTVVCTTGPVGAGLSATFLITVTPTVAEIISNQVVVGGDFVEPPNSSANNFAVVDTAIGAGDLEISKTGLSFVLGGDVLTYTLTITNHGPEPMTGVTVVDDLPPNMSPVSVWPDTLCFEFAGQVTCDGGDFLKMEPDTSLTVIVTGTAPADDIIVNTATVSAVELDIDESNNTDVLTTTTAHAADLEASKFAFENAPGEGGHYANTPLQYLIQVGNNGAFSSTGSIVTDTLPAGVLFGSASPGCGNSGDIITCTVGILDAGLTQEFSVVVTPTIPGEITNTVEIAGVETDPISDNNSFSVATTILPADLVIQKFAPATRLVTETITYTIVITNNGPAPAIDVVMTDTLPVSVTFSTASSSLGSCAGGAKVVCTIGTMLPGESALVTITVSPNDIGQALNEVEVSAVGTDPSQTSDDMDSAVTNIVPVVDLRLQKDPSHDPVIAGTNLTYTLFISNSGPSDATSVVISDTMLTGLNFVGSVPDGACYISVGVVVNCDITGGIAAGASATVELVVQVDPSVPHGDFVINAASVTSDELDSDPFSNRDTAFSEVFRESDLWVDKSAVNDPIAAGETQIYTIQVWNNGPSDATGAVLTDILTSVLSYDDPSSSLECSGPGPTVTCSNLDVPAGDSQTITIVADLHASTPEGILNNTATVSHALDPNSSNDSGTNSSTIILETDMTIEKTGSPKPVVAGEVLTYTIVVTNNGPSDSTGASISDNLPSGLNNAEYCPVTSGTSCTPNMPYTTTTTIPVGPLAVGESATFLIRADVSSSQSNDLINTAIVDANEDDPGINSSQDITTVIGEADLGISKSATPDPVVAGEHLTYTITVDNIGPSDATGIVVTDILTTGLTYSSSLPNNACSGSGQSVSCTEANLPVGQTATFTVVAEVDSSWDAATISNRATVSWDQEDPNPTNNSAQSTADVDRVADLWVNKSLRSASTVAGGLVIYNLTVGNDGPSDASGITVTDILTGVLIPAVGTSSECLPALGQTLDCDISQLPAGTTHVLTITAALDASVAEGTTLSNSASITAANEPDPESGNNTGSVTSTVTLETDLAIAKSGSPDTVVAGEVLTYTIVVTNNGPSISTGSLITDSLPTGLHNEEFCKVISGTSCIPGEPYTGTIGVGPLGVGESATFLIRSDVSSAQSGDLYNTATVGANEFDPGVNSSQDVTAVIGKADLGITKSAAPDLVPAGELLTYTLVVSNSGPSRASEITVTDVLTDVLAFSAAGGSSAECVASILDPQTVICLAASHMDPGDTITFTVVVTVAPSVISGTSLANIASVSADVSDPFPSNDNSPIYWVSVVDLP